MTKSVADKILQLLHIVGTAGASRTRITEYFNRNTPAKQMDALLNALLDAGKARREVRTHACGLGRPAEVWFVVP
jgi:hypothetical protein